MRTTTLLLSGLLLTGAVMAQCSNLTLHIFTDDAGAETSWRIVPAGGGAPICEVLPGTYLNNVIYTETCCLPAGCYRLEVLDAGGDGIAVGTVLLNGIGVGGYILSDANGNTIIDNRVAGDFGSLSTVGLNAAQGFCLPLGNGRIIESQCDNTINTLYEQTPTPGEGCNDGYGGYLIATEVPSVSGAFPDGTSGYQFWIFDPNGTYSRRVFNPHGVYNGMNPVEPPVNTPDRMACFLNFTWLNTNRLPLDTRLNVRVRNRVNGVYDAFGPACPVVVQSHPDPLGTECPMTKLVHNTQNTTFSCGVTRTFGASDKIYANPVYRYSVPGCPAAGQESANRYQFRLVNPGEGYSRNIASGNPGLVLNWLTNPMESYASPYKVTVRASFDSGATWCDWGEQCDLFIGAGPNAGSRSMLVEGDAMIQFWPNPVRRDEGLWLRLQGLPLDAAVVTVDMFDLQGRRVVDKVLPLQDGRFEGRVPLGLEVASGLYLMSVVAGDIRFLERVLVD